MSRIVYITVSAPFGTGEEFIVPEMIEMVRQGHQLLVLPRSPSGVISSEKGVAELAPAWVCLSMFSRQVLWGAMLELVMNLWKVFKCTLTISTKSGTFQNLVKNILVLPKALWTARVIRKWQADHIHTHWALTTSTMAMIASELSGIPWSLTAHRGDIVLNNLLKEKVQHASFVRFISDSGRKLAHSMVKSGFMRKSHVIHMGVDFPETCVNPNLATNVPHTIFCPGNLIPVKGQVFLLKAIATLRSYQIPAELIFVGQGPLAKGLKRKAEDLGLSDSVTFLGQIQHEALLEYYRKRIADLVVLPSIDLGNGLHEGIPISLMEAMSFGIPVISTTTGGIPELVTEGSGILVPPQDPVALAEAIANVLSDATLYARLSLGARERIRTAFRIQDSVHEIVSLMSNIGTQQTK